MATRPVKPPPRQKRTRTEVQKDFDEIQEQITQSRDSGDAKADELARLRDQELKTAFEGFTVETVVGRISELNLQINRALGGISEQLSGEVLRLQQAREAVEVERRELGRLHKIDIALTALDQLAQDYGQKKQELESGIEAREAAWLEQTRTREREQKEYDDNLKRTRQREIEDYEYKKALERKKAQDKYDEEQRLIERRNHERQETLQKSWDLRESALKEKEQEFERLRKEAAEFSTRLEGEVRKAVAETLKTAKAQHEQEKLLLEKEGVAEKRVAEYRIKTLDETVAAQRQHIEALEKRIEEAKAQVQEIAVKAIEGASGARALAHVNQIAIEQAKRPGQQG